MVYPPNPQPPQPSTPPTLNPPNPQPPQHSTPPTLNPPNPQPPQPSTPPTLNPPNPQPTQPSTHPTLNPPNPQPTQPSTHPPQPSAPPNPHPPNPHTPTLRVLGPVSEGRLIWFSLRTYRAQRQGDDHRRKISIRTGAIAAKLTRKGAQCTAATRYRCGKPISQQHRGKCKCITQSFGKRAAFHLICIPFTYSCKPDSPQMDHSVYIV